MFLNNPDNPILKDMYLKINAEGVVLYNVSWICSNGDISITLSYSGTSFVYLFIKKRYSFQIPS